MSGSPLRNEDVYLRHVDRQSAGLAVTQQPVRVREYSLEGDVRGLIASAHDLNKLAGLRKLSVVRQDEL
jgi:hypothetical protein